MGASMIRLLIIGGGLVPLLISCGGGGGGLAAPSGLAYARPPAYVKGQAIPPLRPTVIGTVTAYSVNPALPAGLRLGPTDGNISGTPTTVSPIASYTVTARNAAGATSATVTLTVNDVRPAFAYGANNTLVLTVDQRSGVAPTNTGGQVVSWSVTPALPPDLTFSTKDGSISGTPASAMAPTTFVVTGQNATGSGTATVTVSIQQILLDLGHAANIVGIAVTATRILSIDATAHWALWDYKSGASIINGDVPCGPVPCDGMTFPITRTELAGDTMAVEYPTTVSIYSASDGAALANVAVQAFSAWHLASDGSYLCNATAHGLTVWSPSGSVIVSRSGDYSNALMFCAPGEVRVALGPAGPNVIETITLPAGTSAVSPAFHGVFHSWFLDGESFLSNVNGTVWVYSKAGMQLDLKVTPTAAALTGQGTWFWTFDSNSGALNVYKVGASGSAAASYAFQQYDTLVRASGPTIGVFEYTLTAPKAHVIDLSGNAPSATDYPAGIAGAATYAAYSAAQWIAGNASGVLIDGTTLTGTPRYFDYGAALAIAGSSSRAAIATASGRTLFFDTTSWAQSGSLSAFDVQLALAADGSVLAARSSGMTDSGQPTNVTVTTYAMPTATPINTWTYPIPGGLGLSVDLSLSGSGTALGQVINNGASVTREVTSVSGGPVLWSDVQPPPPAGAAWLPIRLSPSGALVAVANSRDQNAGTQIYLNGTLTSAVSGWPVNWVSDNSLLIQTFSGVVEPVYVGSATYDASGNKIASVALPTLDRTTQVIGQTAIYESGFNQIYSLTTGSATWIGPRFSLISSEAIGAIAGPRVVFAYGPNLIAQPY
jgi:Putative Ig domain